MKKDIFFLFLFSFSSFFLFHTYADNTHQGTGETDGYKLIWQDCFDSDILDEIHNWTIEEHGNPDNNELQLHR